MTETPNTDFIGRSQEMNLLKDFVDKPGSGFTFVRGRRRVGKSWLLKKLQQKYQKRCFYFSGLLDETGPSILNRFIKEWESFTKETSLSLYQKKVLTWQLVFKDITTFASKQNKSIILIFDEIQWMAKTGSGLVGKIKEAWLSWEPSGKIKVILCGSSQKFFYQYSGGSETILRGMKTQASIWVEPFSLKEIKLHYFPQWTEEEICLTYMMLGGIPYYLNQINPELGFIHAINEALFLKESIFLEEVDEVLRIEFNKRGMKTIKKILFCLGPTGARQATIHQKTGLSLSYLSEILDKLVDYQIIYTKNPAHASPLKNEAGTIYYMKDFFLNFYFQILEPLQLRIQNNEKGLLFPHACLYPHHGYYIPQFSGCAFERLIRFILETRKVHESKFFKKLQLLDEDYEVLDYWDKETQIDLLVENRHDRISRVIECKWLSTKPEKKNQWILELLQKKYVPPKNFSRKNYLILSCQLTPSLIEEAKKNGVEIIELKDLF